MLEISSINYLEDAIDQNDHVDCTFTIKNNYAFGISGLAIEIIFSNSTISHDPLPPIPTTLGSGATIQVGFTLITNNTLAGSYDVGIKSHYTINQSSSRGIKVRKD